ncbi:hypothetical protein FGO68_gene16948 [Halteria grandinella]|uniref:Uncharacterized protein n=1 Tax=Halteria grandinella TaxID=5974 RepID=A0A8J8NHH9_HALGN|nr:hypothetical protein FGO68_gene16948 [Halteria grandinella]
MKGSEQNLEKGAHKEPETVEEMLEHAGVRHPKYVSHLPGHKSHPNEFRHEIQHTHPTEPKPDDPLKEKDLPQK